MNGGPVDVTFFAVVYFFYGAQEGGAFLFSQKKITKEKSRLGPALLRGYALAGVVLPCVTLCRILRPRWAGTF
jgi:hypothetical protein